ncbi:MAG: hypothetical protein ACRYG7_23340 [Janthinobacterium lividum]
MLPTWVGRHSYAAIKKPRSVRLEALMLATPPSTTTRMGWGEVEAAISGWYYEVINFDCQDIKKSTDSGFPTPTALNNHLLNA